MKKLISIFVVLVLISLVSAVDYFDFPSDLVISLEDLNQINNNLRYIEDNYGISVNFLFVDAPNSVTGESLNSFYNRGLDSGPLKTWNLLVYYNAHQDKMRFVTYNHCSFELSKLEELRNRPFVQKVLTQNSPSNENIFDMFLGMSEDIKYFVDVYDPFEDDCPEVFSSDRLVLRNDEYTVPPEIMKATYCIDPKHVNPVQAWEYYSGTGAEGIYLPNNLDFTKYFNFEKFENLLNEKTDISDFQIKYSYDLITTPENILLVEGYGDDILFHERFHKIISEELTDSEIKELKVKRSRFIGLLNRKNFFSFLEKNKIYSRKLNYPLISDEEFDEIIFGHWQELYAHIAQYEKYPSVQGRFNYIDDEIYDLFASRYPEAYQIYRKVYNLASN